MIDIISGFYHIAAYDGDICIRSHAGVKVIAFRQAHIPKIAGFHVINGDMAFRTGGDEFIVLTEADRHQAYELLAKLRKEASLWHGRRIKTLSMAAAFALAADHPGYSCEKLIAAADQAMYAEKRAYYQEKNTG